VAVLIDRFISQAARSRLGPFIRLGQTIPKHRDGILAAIHLAITNARTEALNNKVRLITSALNNDAPTASTAPRPPSPS
jgi:transposase